MTGDERLAKVAEVLAGHANWSGTRDPWPDTRWVCTCGEPVDGNPPGVNVVARHRAHVVASLAPLLDEFQAEAWDEGWERCADLVQDDGEFADYYRNPYRAALAAAEPDAGER